MSYILHRELAEKHDGRTRWGYRELNTLDITCEEGRKKGGRPSGTPEWVKEGVVRKASRLGSPETTSQVHPRLFCETIVKESKELEVLMGYATSILTSEDGSVSGVEVEVDGETKSINADAVVVAAGPWTSKLLPNIPITTQRAHSITISTADPVSPHALFTNIKLKNGSVVTPEIYPRMDEIYACGDVDKEVPLPRLAKDVKVDQDRCRAIVNNVGVVSDILKNGEVTVMQA